MRGFLSLVVCMFALAAAAPGRAQEVAAEPSVETVRRALAAERLQLTDAWLLHEDQLERDRLRKGRSWALAGHALLGAGWGAVGVGLVSEQVATGWSVAAFGVSAATLALALATYSVEDHRQAARWSERLLILDAALIGAGVLVARQATHDDNRNVDLLYIGLGAQMLVGAATMAVVRLTAPTLYVSEHYAGYRARTDSERVAYGLSLLVERERRERVAAFAGFSWSVLTAGMHATLAYAIDKPEARPFFAITAGSLLINAGINLVLHLVTRTPSESIVVGLPPPAGDKL